MRVCGGILAILQCQASCHQKEKSQEIEIVGGHRGKDDECNGVIRISKFYLRCLGECVLELRNQPQGGKMWMGLIGGARSNRSAGTVNSCCAVLYGSGNQMKLGSLVRPRSP